MSNPSHKQCLFKSVEDENIVILLKDNEEVILGRSPETNIRDKKCSKKQVSLLADYNSDSVIVTQIGGNASSANGVVLKNDKHLLKHGETFEFIVGKYPFKLEFNPPPHKVENMGKRKNDTKHSNGSNSPNSKRFCNENKAASEAQRCETNTWEKIEDGKLYVFTSVGVTSSSKIAAYDMDGTLILTKSGRVFPKDKDDWKIAYTPVKTKLAKLISEGFKIVILTNQAGIGRGKTNINEFKLKIEGIVAALGVPVQVFIATSNSIHRKPAPGMWNYLQDKKNDGITIVMKESFYVGDAAGRIANWTPGKKKDFSCADRLLAMNLKLCFYTPEEHFLNERPGKYNLPPFNPGALDENVAAVSRTCDSDFEGDIVSKTQEVVVMVGYPGSGKSHFVRQHLLPAGYVHVNRDTLGSWQKCVQTTEAALAAGKSVVVDNTNPDRESRQRYIQSSKGTPVRCFVMTTSIEHVRHNLRFRELTDPKHVPVNEMIVNSYKNKYEPPSLEEGFSQVIKVNFVPSFSTRELKKLYQMYLVEK